ncbi:unnamed protein product [Prunus armeniaca]
MSGEELAGPPAPKLLRLLYFVGAGCNASPFYNSSNSSLKMPQMLLSDLQV